MRSIIWDWNGTLLDDLDWCIASINTLLSKRKLNKIDSTKYKEVFSFPVKDYYEAIGFDFSREDFSIPAGEFIDIYNSGVEKCSLHPEAVKVLSNFKTLGKRQFVLSAMKQDMLEHTLKDQKIDTFFEGVFGLDHHYATSKIERGEQLISQYKIEKESAVIIGDTIHDFEVARQLGISCILISNGHQSTERLKSTGTKVVADLTELLKNGLSE